MISPPLILFSSRRHRLFNRIKIIIIIINNRFSPSVSWLFLEKNAHHQNSSFFFSFRLFLFGSVKKFSSSAASQKRREDKK
tara:strand:- start:241 stop:483 length:243 start_codon:yes stop_codon:yes gene_type:complete